MTTTLCQHGETTDCLECEISFRREYLVELDALVADCERQISQLVQRRRAKEIPIVGGVECDGMVTYWEGLGPK